MYQRKTMGNRGYNREETMHHVPPTSTCRDFSKQFVKRLRRSKHEAYHTLFANLPTFEACVEELRKYWTPD
jgi:hypothetical protein